MCAKYDGLVLVFKGVKDGGRGEDYAYPDCFGTISVVVFWRLGARAPCWVTCA